MNDPVVQSLRQAVAAHGEALLQNPAELEKQLADVAASFPGKVKALSIMLDKKAVTFLTNWSKDARPDKSTYEQVRHQIAGKFEQAKLLNGAAAGWALDAWAVALGLRQEATNAAPAAAATAGGGLSLQEEPRQPASAAPVAQASAPAAARPTPAQANPYAPPSAPVADPVREADFEAFIDGGRGVAAGRGWTWFAEGWQLFRESPLIWIVNFVLLMVILIGVQLVPLIGGIIGTLLAPVLGAGIMIGARAVHQGEALQVGHLFAGFRERAGSLVLVGVLYLVGTLIIVLAVVLLIGVSVMGVFAGGAQAQSASSIMLGVLVALALIIPLVMAYWFAPALVALNGSGAVDAMKMSFSACLKNIVPFLVYGLIGLVLGILALIPLGLGLFILGPVGMASMYASYRDIFYEE